MESYRVYVTDSLAALDPNTAPLVYTVFLALYITACFPSEPIEFLPGFLFGWLKGTLVSICGKLLGLALSMVIGRYLFREKIRAFVFRKFPIIRKIAVAVQKEGFWAIVVVRSLAIPAAVKNYGISSCLDVSLIQNLAASAVIIVPHSLVWAWLGESASTISTNYHEVDTATLFKQVIPDPFVLVLLGLPLVLGFATIIKRVSKRILIEDIHLDDVDARKAQ